MKYNKSLNKLTITTNELKTAMSSEKEWAEFLHKLKAILGLSLLKPSIKVEEK